MTGGHLFVISGASGVGKSTILKQVMAKRPNLQFSVSATSRAPREGEVNGVQYFFISEDAFRDCIHTIRTEHRSANVSTEDDLLAFRDQLKKRKGLS